MKIRFQHSRICCIRFNNNSCYLIWACLLWKYPTAFVTLLTCFHCVASDFTASYQQQPAPDYRRCRHNKDTWRLHSGALSPLHILAWTWWTWIWTWPLTNSDRDGRGKGLGRNACLKHSCIVISGSAQPYEGARGEGDNMAPLSLNLGDEWV